MVYGFLNIILIDRPEYAENDALAQARSSGDSWGPVGCTPTTIAVLGFGDTGEQA